MMRWVLNALYMDALLVAAPYWLWKVPQARRYRAGLAERLGFVRRMRSGVRRLWVHAASVGEASVPQNLISLFRRRHPDWEVVFSTFTDTGADRLRSLYPDCPVFYWPLDLSWCVERSLERIRPDAVVLVEQELWPNYLVSCLERNIPVAIANGRINGYSADLLGAVGRICPATLEAVKLCCARSTADAELFAHAGMRRERIFPTGSLKYDALALEVEPARREQLRRRLDLAPGSPVLVAGSTHPGEDEMLCEVYEKLRLEHGGLRLLLVPRHIERAARLARTLGSMGLAVVRKSELDSGARTPSQNDVVLIDTIGELTMCYSLATCAFVGRSLLAPGGGQNMMEPAALGRPVIVGPYTGNFEPEMKLLTARRAVVVVRDGAELLRELRRLLGDHAEARRVGQNARTAVIESRGAAERTLERLEQMLAGAGPAP